MDEDTRFYLETRIDGLRRELQILEEIYNELIKPKVDVTPKAQQPTKDEFASLKWIERLNRNQEPIQEAFRKDNQDNPAFQKVHSYVQDRGGFVKLHGFSLWIDRKDSNILGRKPLAKTPKESKPAVESKAEKKRKPAQPASLTSYDDSKINYKYNESKFGPKTVASDIAFPDNNKDNPTFDSILGSLKTRKAAGEKIKPYWLFSDGSGFGKNITKKT